MKKKHKSSTDNQMDPEDIAFADELGMGKLLDPIFSSRGRLFSTAGPQSPVAEFTEEYLLLYPPDKPLNEQAIGEDIVKVMSKEGVLLNEVGQPRTIPGARYRGQKLFCFAHKNPETNKYPVVWFDENGDAHKLYWQETEVSVQAAFRLRNRTHDGELSIFPELTSLGRR